MKELIFKVKFLSDVVLPASSNTEGNIEKLDFIPGSNFLGMVAKTYDEFENTFSVFHSGAVRFSDASVLIDNQSTYKMPLSFFHEKLDDSLMINHHLISDFSAFSQLKQKRKGYITKDLKEIEINHNYAQKSAYDKTSRRSKEGSMYGYDSLPSGMLWKFTVLYDETISSADIERIKQNLVGKQRLGKSKSAQYGAVEIMEYDSVDSINTFEPKDDLTYLYSKSRLALVDEEGIPTYNLAYLTEDLDDSQVVWEMSQIKTSTFTPYNGAMRTKSYERLVINSGSVIVLKNLSEMQKKQLTEGVGVYLSEGFGEILINPSFLGLEGKFSFKDNKDNVDDKVSESRDISNPMVKFLKLRATKKENELELAHKVSQFINDNKNLYSKINNAQWGTIRSICGSPSNKFREEIREYISDGKVTWNTQQIEMLLEEGKSRAFIKLVSMQMPKLKGEA